jgi:hypothetical protein
VPSHLAPCYGEALGRSSLRAITINSVSTKSGAVHAPHRWEAALVRHGISSHRGVPGHLPPHTNPPRVAKSIETRPASSAVNANGRAFGSSSIFLLFQFVASLRASQPIIAGAVPWTSSATRTANTRRSTAPVSHGGTLSFAPGLRPRPRAPRNAYRKTAVMKPPTTTATNRPTVHDCAFNIDSQATEPGDGRVMLWALAILRLRGRPRLVPGGVAVVGISVQ